MPARLISRYNLSNAPQSTATPGGRTMNETVIQVKDFRKTYGPFVAVDGISFEVERGEIFGLLGPNGAGKTSTPESLEGLRFPDGGSLRIAGVDPARQTRQLRSLIGVQLQTSGLPESIRVDEALRLFCAYHGAPARDDLIDRVGLAEKRTAQYHQLSAGQQRRLSLALAVAHKPPVLFLDEPTAGLDVASRGMLVALGTPLEITATGAGLTKISVRTEGSSLTAQGLSFPAVAQTMTEGEYVIFFSRDIGPTISALIAHLAAQGDALIDLRVERPSLEDRFLEITTKGA